MGFPEEGDDQKWCRGGRSGGRVSEPRDVEESGCSNEDDNRDNGLVSLFRSSVEYRDGHFMTRKTSPVND